MVFPLDVGNPLTGIGGPGNAVPGPRGDGASERRPRGECGRGCMAEAF